jgi:hypothetical protein
MSIWSDNPEWFDEWIETEAMDGRFGEELRKKVENGDLVGYELWDLDGKGKLPGIKNDGSLGSEASTAYCERMMD